MVENLRSVLSEPATEILESAATRQITESDAEFTTTKTKYNAALQNYKDFTGKLAVGTTAYVAVRAALYIATYNLKNPIADWITFALGLLVDAAALRIVYLTTPNQEDLLNKLEKLEANYDKQAHFHFPGRPILHCVEDASKLPTRDLREKSTCFQKIGLILCAGLDPITDQPAPDQTRSKPLERFRPIRTAKDATLHSEDQAYNIKMAPFVRNIENLFTTTLTYTPILSGIFTISALLIETLNPPTTPVSASDVTQTFNETVSNLTNVLVPHLQC